MTKLKKVNLPKTYQYIEGVSRPEYKKFDGWQKISFSQFTSFLDEDDEGYRGSYIGGYILGEKDKGNEFSYFGSACGDYVNPQDQRVDEYLDDDDKAVLDPIIKEHPENAEFEFEILIDLETFGLERTCLQGFSDRQHLVEDGSVEITDYKTLNMVKKKNYYASDSYNQMQVYGYGLEELGYNIGRTYVTGLGRKGNKLDKTALHYNGTTNMGIRLSGEVEIIDNPYNRKKAENAIKEIVKVCLTIHEYKKVYEKYFK